MKELWGDKEVSPETFDEVFAVMDADGSGNIDKEEMAIFLKKLARVSGPMERPTTELSIPDDENDAAGDHFGNESRSSPFKHFGTGSVRKFQPRKPVGMGAKFVE